MEFCCDKCGKCCRLLGGIPQLATFDRGDGVCIHLQGNLCDIYESRPDICNVEKMFSRFSQEMNYEQYISLMTRSCQYLKTHFDYMRQKQTPCVKK